MPPKKEELPPGFAPLQALVGHSGIVNRVAWSPDGLRLASTSNDGTVRIWRPTRTSPSTAKPFQTFTGGQKRGGASADSERLGDITYDVSWSPDASKLVTGSHQGFITLWHVSSGTLLWESKFDEPIIAVDFSPDGRLIAAGCLSGFVYILDAESGSSLRQLLKHYDAVSSVAWSPTGNLLASTSEDRTLLLWDTKQWKVSRKLEAHSKGIRTVSWSPTGEFLATGSQDRTIRIWEAKSGRFIAILEGHITDVRSLSFSFDGRFLISLSPYDFRLWRTDTYELAASLSKISTVQTAVPPLAFHPNRLEFVTHATNTKALRIWKLDAEVILDFVKASPPPSSHYSNARVVLVGDSGVGKSGLALVLTGQPWTETGSTHGRRVWVLDTSEVEKENGIKETRETLLWDLAGQPDYRLIHQLHLTDVAVALVVFDSKSQTDPFAGVHHWNRAIRQAQRVQSDTALQSQKFLVAARVDVGRISASPDRIEWLKRDLNFDGYYETSAKEGWGIKALIDAIHEGIDWSTLPTVSSTELFQNIKAFLAKEKESGRLLSSMDDLYRAFLNEIKPVEPTDELRRQFETCIGRVESRGLIQRLSFGNLILLQPEFQDVYASAMANAVKDEPDGLGSIREEKARAGAFRMPEDERIKDSELEKLLLISTVEDLLRHEIALREQGENGQYLVFPSQFTREHPDLPDPEGKAVIFNFEGPILNIYATLAVRLSYSGFFKRKEMWKNAATYSTSAGGTYGMFLREVNEGRGELTLFFDPSASEESRFQFEQYVRAHLDRRSLPDTLNRRRIFVCDKCNTPVSDLAAKRRKERGFDWMSCNVCEPPTRISLRDREERLHSEPVSTISEMDRAADTQREKATAASILLGKIATNDFDVFLCHNSADKPEVKKIAELLKERGILPWLDEWELRPGKSWQRLLEKQIEHIKSAAVFVGEAGLGPWQHQELDAFLREFVNRDCPVIPVLLENAPSEPQLPVFLKGLAWVDFRNTNPSPLNRLIWGITGQREFDREFY